MASPEPLGLDLSCDELDAVARVCSEIDREAGRPASLQGFLAFRLRDRHAALAKRIEAMTAYQLDLLWDDLLDRDSAGFWATY